MEAQTMSEVEPLLKAKGLVTEFKTEDGTVRAVDRVHLEIYPGETVGLVGESGCGKTVTALSLLKLIPEPTGSIEEGSVIFEGISLFELKKEAFRAIRGNQIGMVFQEPMTALNPVHTIGKQLCEPMLLHKICSKRDAAERAKLLLNHVGVPDPEERLHEFPHQLSGGMRQRVSIAMALACKPSLLIADEPTTALDATIQLQILELLRNLKEELNMSMLFITHDLGVVAELCDRVIVMYAGKVVEEASVFELFENPKHPYTQGLIKSIPTLKSPHKQPLPAIKGQVPNLRNLPQGCRFENRCPHAQAQCREIAPILETVKDRHNVRCIRWKDI